MCSSAGRWMFTLACLVLSAVSQKHRKSGRWLVIPQMSCPVSPSPPRPPRIYSQTDGSYMGSPEMSPLYSTVNALTQTAATITLILPFSPLVLHSPFIFTGSISVSRHPFRSRTDVHTHANRLSLESNWSTLKHLRSLPSSLPSS